MRGFATGVGSKADIGGPLLTQFSFIASASGYRREGGSQIETIDLGQGFAMMGTGHDVRGLVRDEGAFLRRQPPGSPR